MADLSFISLTLVLPALVGCAAPDADFVLMVKPQFEVGRERGRRRRGPGSGAARGGGGTGVAAAAAGLGLGVAGVTASPLPGPSGNVEYFLWLRRGAPPLDEATLRAGDRGGPAVTAARATGERRGPCCWSPTPAGRPRCASRGVVGRQADRRPASPSGCWSPRPPSSAARRPPWCRSRRPRRRAPRWCWSSAATARCCGPRSWPGRRRAAARRQPRPRRLPGRGRAGGPVRRRATSVRGRRVHGRAADDGRRRRSGSTASELARPGR